MKTVLIIIAALAFAYLLAFGLMLLVGHKSSLVIPLGLVALLAIGWTAWLLKSDSGAGS
ncbi:MAG: hypothetical protein ACNA8J_06845 [Gammaproteobacteria bacterium]